MKKTYALSLALMVVITLMIVGAALYLLTRPGAPLAAWLNPSAKQKQVGVYVTVPPLVDLSSEFDLVVTVTNEGQEYLTVEEMRLPANLLQVVQVVSLFPGKVEDGHAEQDYTGYPIGFVIAPNDYREFVFTLMPLEMADIGVDVQVVVNGEVIRSGVRLAMADVVGLETSEEPTLTPTFPPTNTPFPTVTLPPTLTPTPINRIPYQAVVMLTSFYDSKGRLRELWRGSGSIISPDGLILTNAHLVVPVNRLLPEIVKIMVSLTVVPDQPPRPAYYAEVLEADKELDIALLRIVTDLDGKAVDATRLNLPTVPLGDSDKLQLGNPLIILGYPGIGGDTVTLTRGEVGGFTSDKNYGSRAFVKTSAVITGGASGGMVLDENGLLVGIPTRVGAGDTNVVIDCRVVVDTNGDGKINEDDTCVPLGGFINALRPVNLALPMIRRAKGEALSLPTPMPTEEVPQGSVILFEDDFSQETSGWSIWSTADGSVGYQDGGLQIRVDKENQLYWGYAPGSYADVILTVAVRLINPVGDGKFGAICRYQDRSNFYALMISEDGAFSIFKMVQGAIISLVDWSVSTLVPTSGEMRLTAACINDKLTLIVNDRVIAQASDTTFTSGNFGLLAGVLEKKGLVVLFDDLVVKAP